MSDNPNQDSKRKVAVGGLIAVALIVLVPAIALLDPELRSSFIESNQSMWKAQQATDELSAALASLEAKQAALKERRESEVPTQPEWPKADLTPKPRLELLESKGTTNEYSTTITGKIKNNTSRTYTYVQVLFDVYDSSGNRVGSAIGNINNLGPLETWKFQAVYIGEDGKRFRLDEITGF